MIVRMKSHNAFMTTILLSLFAAVLSACSSGTDPLPKVEPTPPKTFTEIVIFSVLIALSLFKFVSVIAWFMHLIYDRLLLTLAFGTGLAIATGTVIALMFIMDRGFVDFEAITAF